MALALFGSLLVRRGDIKIGGWFSMIAKDLSEKIGSKECASEYLIINFNEIFSLLNHIHASQLYLQHLTR